MGGRVNEAKHDKKVFLNTSASTSIIADLSHCDLNTTSSFCRAEEPNGVEAVNHSMMPIGRGPECLG